MARIPKPLTVKQIAKIVVPILKKNKVSKAAVFGSYARGDVKKTSDVDLLVQPPRGMGLQFVGLKLELEEKLGRKVDLLTYASISPYIKRHIMTDKVRIL